MWLLGLGTFVIGFTFGYATGLSKTRGTATKALGILAGLVGSVAFWISIPDQAGIVLTCIGLGFSIGITFGAKIRRRTSFDVMEPRMSHYMHHEATPLVVSLYQAMSLGLIIGLVVVLCLHWLRPG
jgi:hypothetical protein